MHVELFEALTSAQVDAEKARVVVQSLEKHMENQITNSIEGKVLPTLHRIEARLDSLETNTNARFDRAAVNMRWTAGIVIAICIAVVRFWPV